MYSSNDYNENYNYSTVHRILSAAKQFDPYPVLSIIFGCRWPSCWPALCPPPYKTFQIKLFFLNIQGFRPTTDQRRGDSDWLRGAASKVAGQMDKNL